MTRPRNIQDLHEVLDLLDIKTYDDEQFLMVNYSNLNIRVVMFSYEILH
jgi:hypothetical protein